MEEVTSKSYDDRVTAQGLQFQINNYYEPKDEDAKRRIDEVMKALDPKDGEEICDIGCGVGTFAFHAAMEGSNTVGVDYSVKSVIAARNLGGMYNIKGRSSFAVADASNLPFKDYLFDKVVCADFVEHITLSQKESLLDEIGRILKKGGRAVIFTPNKIREDLGMLYRKARHLLFGDHVPGTDLHLGLTAKSEFESLLKRRAFKFRLFYKDVTRPFLARLPILKTFLALNLLWIVEKR